MWLIYEWNDNEIILNFDNFEKEIGIMEIMRIVGVVWFNIVKYRLKILCYIIYGIYKKREDIF